MGKRIEHLKKEKIKTEIKIKFGTKEKIGGKKLV